MIERSIPTRCRGCDGRPRFGGVLFKYNGRLTDGSGNEVPEAATEPCPVCGGAATGPVKILVGVDPAWFR